MRRGNPSSRRGTIRSSFGSTTANNRDTFGGNVKAGIGGFTGYGSFANNAIQTLAPRFAGPNYQVAGAAGRVPVARDLYNRPITNARGVSLYYPISFVTQSTGISSNNLRFALTSGVNVQQRINAAISTIIPN
jgi:hypothetical protein